MLPPVILFEDEVSVHLEPLTLTRPVHDLRVGLLTIREQWMRALGVRRARQLDKVKAAEPVRRCLALETPRGANRSGPVDLPKCTQSTQRKSSLLFLLVRSESNRTTTRFERRE